MRIIRAKIAGFRSFAGNVTMEPPARAGLFLVRGVNGAGKSTLFDAICWCFYGKTSRGLSGPSVESWDAERTDVSVKFADAHGAKHTVRRTRGPNALLLDGDVVEQHVVDDLLGLDYERFLHVVLLGQFGSMFCDLRPQQRLDLFTSVLGLERWTAAAKRAGETADVLADAQREAEVDCGRCEARVTTLRDELQRAVDDCQEIEQRGEQRLAQAKQRLARAAEDVKKTTDRLVSSQTILAKWEKHHKRRIAGAEALFVAAEKQDRVVARLAGTVDAMAPSTDGKCPTCGQAVKDGRKHDKGKHADAVAALTKARAAMSEARAAAQAGGASLVRFKARMDAVVAAVHKRLQSQQDAQVEYDAAKAALDDEGTRGEDLTGARDRVVRLRADIEAAEWDLTAAEAAQFDHASEQEAVAQWVGRFREVRLWLVDEALAELTIAVNSALHALGLPGWSVTFSCERETQAGTIARGFTIAVSAPGAPDGVPWEAWSGGETQRLRVACAAGLAELVHRRMASPPTWEVWDEPTAHLERSGVDALVSFFADRAQRRQVWLIDHRSLDAGAFAAVVTVTKTADGGSVLSTR